MTAVLLDRAMGPVLSVAVATGEVVPTPSPVDDLPADFDMARDFFAGCVTTFDLPPYIAMVGPLTASPGLTLADVVRGVAG